MSTNFNIKKLFQRALNSPTIINIITVGIITVIVKGFGFYKEIVVAGSFGLSELLDTFFIASLLPGFVSEVFLNSFNTVFIPNYISEQKTIGNVGSFQSISILVTLLASLFFIIVAYLFTDLYLETFFAGHTQSYYDLVKLQFYYLLPCILFWGLTSLLGGLLSIHDEFRFTSIVHILTAIAIIICLMFFRDILGDAVLAIGTLIGSIAQFGLLLLVALNKQLIQLRKPDFLNSNIVIMLKQVPAKVSSSLLVGINPIVDQFFSAKLVIGSITALNYGIKIPAFMISIVTVALGNVLLPYFSKSVLDNRDEAFRNLNQILKYVIIGGTAIVLIICLFSTPIISFLFERDAFTSADSIKVSKIQQMYALQIPFYICAIIIVRFLISINKNNFMVLASLISLILNIILNYVLIQTMEVYGLALATSLVSIVNSIVLYIYICFIKRHLDKLGPT